MVGRKHKSCDPLFREVVLETAQGHRVSIGSIQLLCPACGSGHVGPNGTQQVGRSRCEEIICHNPECMFLSGHQKGKQFRLTTSLLFKQQAWSMLRGLYHELVKEGAKGKTIAHVYGISEAEVSYLRAGLANVIEAQHGLDKLVEAPQSDTAVAIDETFLKIEGKTVYVIIATGYTTHKTLGVRVSATRKEADLGDVFREAERNVTGGAIPTASADAWAATQAMVANLRRPVTLVIHKHKAPYDRAVIRTIEYTAEERVITDIGVKVDVFARRGKREFHHMTRRELLNSPAPNPKGRPKGVKNGHGKKKKRPKHKQKRGRKGLFAVFEKGTKGYLRVDPAREKMRVGKDCPKAVAAALGVAFTLYTGLAIQNNLSENINCVLQSIVRLKGPKTIESVEKLLRATLIVRNDPTILDRLTFTRRLRAPFFFKNVKVADFAALVEKGWKILYAEKREVLVN